MHAYGLCTVDVYVHSVYMLYVYTECTYKDFVCIYIDCMYVSVSIYTYLELWA